MVICDCDIIELPESVNVSFESSTVIEWFTVFVCVNKLVAYDLIEFTFYKRLNEKARES